MARTQQPQRAAVQAVESTTSSTAATTNHDDNTHDNGDVGRTQSQVVFYGDDDDDDDDDDYHEHENGNGNGRDHAGEGRDDHAFENEENIETTTTDNVAVISYPTMLGAVANLCSATLGAGVLALPFALEQAGLICGLLLLLGSAWSTTVSIELLVVACDIHSLSTYEQVVQQVLGQRARQVVEGSILLFCIGCAVAYLIAVGDIVEQLLWIEEKEGDASKEDAAAAMSSRRWAIVLVWMFAMLPLSCLRLMKSLQCASGVGLASIGTLLLAAAVHLVQHYNDDVPSSLEKLTLGSTDQDIGSKSLFLHWISSVVHKLKPFVGPSQGSILSVLRACPIVLFSFSCQVNVCQIYDELPGSSKQQQGRRVSPTQDDGNGVPTSNTTISTTLEEQQQQQQYKIRTMSGITWTAMALCAFLYTSISVVTLMDFGALLQPNVLSSYHATQSPRDALLHVAFAAMAVAVIMAFPLNIFPARVCIFQMCFSDQNKPQEDDAHSIISLVQQHNGGVVAVSGGSHHDNYVMGVDSSSHMDALSQPLLMRHQRDVEEQEQQQQRQRQATHQEESGQGEEAVDEDGRPSASYSPSTGQHMIVTVLVAGLALVLALVVPNISIVFGLLGGTTASLLGFVIPGWLGLCLEDSSSSTGGATGITIHHHRAKAWFLVVAGSVVGVVTTGVTLYSTIHDLHVV